MRPAVSSKLRQTVSDLVSRLQVSAGDENYYDATGRRHRLGGLSSDLVHFRDQTKILDDCSIKQYAAIFTYNGSREDSAPVIVQVPDLDRPRESYEGLLDALRKSDVRIDKVDSKVAQDIFIDRASEFLAARSAALNAPAVTLTVVNSNRSGDTVLYAKGYFVSTGMALGISTPAKGSLSGTYSFGIMDSGNPRFESVLWSCPTTVRLNLP